MSRRPVRLLAALGLVLLAVSGWRAFTLLPGFGSVPHPYGARAVDATFQHATANAVMSVTLDQRAFDTLGEEIILLGSAIGTVLLLRRMRAEEEESGAQHTYGPEEVFESLRLTGYVLLPVTVLVGLYIVVHGHLSPGGGFQGGVVLATALHLSYLAGDYRTLERLRPLPAFDVAESLGAAAYLSVGLGGLVAGSALLQNVLPQGRLGDLLSAGTVPVLNVAIGVEVASAFVLILAKFLEQALLVREHDVPGDGGSGDGGEG